MGSVHISCGFHWCGAALHLREAASECLSAANHSTPLSATVNGLYRQPGCSFLCHFLLLRLISSWNQLCTSGAILLQEGSACSPVIVSVSMAPQVRDSQVLEWAGRLMPWKGEVSRLFSTSLNIVSKDVLPTLHCWAMQGRSIFSCVLSSWLIVHFKRREQENVTAKTYYTRMYINNCKDILHMYVYQSLYLI